MLYPDADEEKLKEITHRVVSNITPSFSPAQAWAIYDGLSS